MEEKMLAHNGAKMSMPRKAMKEMGLQVCCLMCDAQDIAGSERCKHCISQHSSARHAIDSAPPESKIRQLGEELFQMIANPHLWDHDEIHGNHLRNYQFLAGQLTNPKEPDTVENIAKLFAKQKEKKDVSLIRDFANQNPWKHKPPTASEIVELSEDLGEGNADLAGKRTIPSKTIAKIDRTDRIGEDLQLSDRVRAQQIAASKPKEERKEIAEKEVTKRKKKRKLLQDTIEGVDEFIAEVEESEQESTDLGLDI
jgi:hypothetical protein